MNRNSGIYSSHITHEGDITPCPHVSIQLGNVKTDNLKELWLKSRVLNDMRDRNSLKGKCRGCKYRKICGGHRVRALYDMGDYNAEDTGCPFV
jgi:radical SAM protein with 4Fe4S-binding SPASM domain